MGFTSRKLEKPSKDMWEKMRQGFSVSGVRHPGSRAENEHEDMTGTLIWEKIG